MTASGHGAECDARAVVLVWTTDERAFGEPFEGPDCLNRAHVFADDLRERGDFPDALICTTGNEAATQDRKARIFASLGTSVLPPAETDGAS